MIFNECLMDVPRELQTRLWRAKRSRLISFPPQRLRITTSHGGGARRREPNRDHTCGETTLATTRRGTGKNVLRTWLLELRVNVNAMKQVAVNMNYRKLKNLPALSALSACV